MWWKEVCSIVCLQSYSMVVHEKKYMVISLLILDHKQSGNDIDIFFILLVEDISKLWRDCVRIYDAYMKEHYIIWAIIFCTINNFSAFGNMSGLKTKCAKACPIRGDETHSIRLKIYNKNVYMRHHRFLTRYHLY
jgi:Transposase family tnp2